MLLIDSDEMNTINRDEEKKRHYVRSFRLIKAAEKERLVEEDKCIELISKQNRKLSKT